MPEHIPAIDILAWSGGELYDADGDAEDIEPASEIDALSSAVEAALADDPSALAFHARRVTVERRLLPRRAITRSWMATGNTARIRRLDAGLIEPGRAADLVFLDRAQHSAGRDLLHSIEIGDIPGIGMVMVDGAVRCGRSRNTPPAERVPELLGH